jgi:hypothetical protein
MTTTVAALLDSLKAAADRSSESEAALRRDVAQRIAVLERERAFAFRKLNLMRAVTAAVTSAEKEDDALTRAASAVRDGLGWDTTSEARTEVIDRFAPVALALFQARASEAAESSDDCARVLAALSAFETWYANSHTGPFWALFDQYVPQTPVVDF